VQNSLNQLDNRHHAEINLAILDWLSPLDYSTQQADHQGVRQKGSGEWFLNADKFQRWVKEENQMLLCPGMPGAGKTIMMSVVVDHLLSKFREDPKPGIAYFYFDYKLQDEQNIGRLLGCLLRQLVAYLPSLPEVVYRLYEKNNNPGRRTRPSNEDLFQALKFVTMSYPRVYVLIDALDHYKPPKDPRLAITRCISEIRTETGANILVTSRFDPEITSGFSSIHSLEIRASNEDVQRYVKASMVHLPRFIQDDPKLQDEVFHGVSLNAQGMFLAARLRLQSLQRTTTPNEVTADLNNSATYDEHYTNMMKIIDNQSEQEKELASSVLSWLILAKRPMRVTELQHAVSVKPGESKFDHGNMPDIGRMVSVCAGLVKVGDESKIIELIHHTAQEYLQQMFVIWFPEARSKITRTCITYLSYKVSELIPGDDRDPIISHIDSHPFYGYASLYWGKHAREEPLLSREVKEFLTDTARIKSYRKILKHVQWHEDRLGDSGLKQQTTGLHLAAWFGLTEAVPLLLNKFPINVKNKFRETALHIATHRADKDIIQLLLDNKAKTKVKNKLGRTPLHIAAEDSDEDVVEQLLNGGASIEAIDRWGDTPLHLAAYTGLGVIVPVLLERDANINPAGQNGHTPLHLAAMYGNYEDTETLLDEEADFEATDDRGNTPLHCAAMMGESDLVGLLLKSGANINATNENGQTALHKAVSSTYNEWEECRCEGHEEAVKKLLGHNPDIEAADNTGATPLHLAVKAGHQQAAESLLSKGARVDATDHDGKRPIDYAQERYHSGEDGSSDLVQLLLDNGATIQDTNRSNQTEYVAPEIKNESAESALRTNSPVRGSDMEIEDLDIRMRKRPRLESLGEDVEMTGMGMFETDEL
ncbi:hypothetical protein N5P37_009218, partial [Trichoderma harzianum]